MEISINPIFATIDIVQNAIDISSLMDYTKINFKKEVIWLNAQDFFDQGNKGAKSDSNKFRQDGIVKAIKSKIDSDLQKILDAKKKLIASIEKSKTAALTGRQSKSRHADETARYELPFKGKIDAIFFIQNFPYIPQQLQACIEGGLNISAFIAITPKECILNTSRTNNAEKGLKSERSGKKSIYGSELDYTLNPSAYPPPRWLSLQQSAPPNIYFTEIHTENSNSSCSTSHVLTKNQSSTSNSEAENIFKKITDFFIETTNINYEFEEFIQKRNIIEIPLCPIPFKLDLGSMESYLSEHENDFVNSLFYVLQASNYKLPKSVQPPPNHELDSLFSTWKTDLNRNVICFEMKESPKIPFEFSDISLINSTLYPLQNWKTKPENANAIISSLRFTSSPENFYAYAGQKFDILFTTANKKYGLQMPVSFFDWSKWNYQIDYSESTIPLQEALHSSSIIEKLLDENTGILWIMCLSPVAKNQGQTIKWMTSPPTLQNISEYTTHIFDKGSVKTRKSGNNISPANIKKENGDISNLLSSNKIRFSEDQKIFRFPFNVGQSADFDSPFFFESGLRVDSQRKLLHGKLEFGYSLFYNNLIEVYSTSQSTVINLLEGIRLIHSNDGTLTILFNDKSIYFDGKQLICKTTGEDPSIIMIDGSFITKHAKYGKIIVYPNGNISHTHDNKWIKVTKSGDCFEKLLPNIQPNEIVSHPSINQGNTKKEQSTNQNFGKKSKNSQLNETESNCSSSKVSQTSVLSSITPLIENIYHLVEKPHSSLIDYSSNITTLIRPDNIEYQILDDGSRLIIFDEDLSIKQIPKDHSILFEMSSSIIISKKDDCFNFNIDRFNISLSPTESHLLCDDYSFETIDRKTHIKTQTNELLLSTSRLEVKDKDTVLVLDEDGTEKLGTIVNELPAKKKMEILSTKWGKAIPIKETLSEQQLNSLTEHFIPQFFAVYSQKLVSEFVRPSSLDIEGYTKFQNEITYTDGSQLPIVSYHHPEKDPLAFIEHTPLDKIERANILKNLHIPKLTKKGTTSQEEEEQLYNEAERMLHIEHGEKQAFIKAFSRIVSINENSFQLSIQEPSVPQKEILYQPPETPIPRLLRMQYNLYQMTIKSNHGEPLDYWKCPEADYAMPIEEEHSQKRPLSSRVNLYDPPRVNAYDNPPDIVDEFSNNSKAKISDRGLISLKSPHLSKEGHSLPPVTPPHGSRSQNVSKTYIICPTVVQFRNIVPQTTSTQSITLTNTGRTPLHYGITPPENKLVRVFPASGVVFPGLKTTIKIAISPGQYQDISTSFSINSNLFTTKIPIIACIASLPQDISTSVQDISSKDPSSQTSVKSQTTKGLHK